MYGPRPAGFWTSHLNSTTPQPWGHLRPSVTYRVCKPFTDYDQDLHPVDETWTFLGYSYLPYDSGLSLFVSVDGISEWNIPMMCVPEEQGGVVDRFVEYVVEG